MLTTLALKQALLVERQASFFRLRGAYPVPLAGATWWAFLGVAGYRLPHHWHWIMLAFVTSGLIFPLAIAYGRLFRNNFMRDQTAVSDALFPTLMSMVLFWPIAFAAFPNAPELVPLVLAIGMSVAWPVMGWMYGRTALFTAHAVVRAVVCFVIWTWFPAQRFTGLPLAVSGIYLVTVAAIPVSSRKSAQEGINASSGSAQALQIPGGQV